MGIQTHFHQIYGAYSDATPDVTFTYTRTGQKATVTDAAGTREFAYTAELGEASESIDGSLYTNAYHTQV